MLCRSKILKRFTSHQSSSLIPSLDVLNKQALPEAQSEVSAQSLTIQQMMNAGLHLGHFNWHKNMLPYIYGRRSGIHIINLEHTLTCIRRALGVTRHVALDGGVILFVGMRAFQREILHSSAVHSKQFYVHEHWTTGCLTNHQRTLKRASPQGVMLQPDLVVCLDMKESAECLKECETVQVPVIGLCDTDCDPSLVTYAIPGNDDSTASVELVAYLLASAARDGQLERELNHKQLQPKVQQRGRRGFQV